MTVSAAILLLSTVGYLYFFSVFGKLRLACAPLLWVLFVILWMYIFALAGALVLGVYTCAALGLVLGSYSLVKKPKHLWRRYRLLELWGCLYAAPYFVLLLAVPQYYRFMGWDEFSFWGLSLKVMALNETLYNVNAQTQYDHYPPAQQLFQYYVIKLAGWSDAHVLYAQNFFVLSTALFAVAGFFKRETLLGPLVFAAVTCLPFFFQYSYSYIYPDQLLAMCLCAGLVLAYRAEQDWVSLTSLMALLSVTILIKEIGFFFAVAILSMFALSVLFRLQMSTILESGPSPLGRYKQPLAAIFACLVCMLFIEYSWQAYLHTLALSRDLQVPPLSEFLAGERLQVLESSLTELSVRVNRPTFLSFMIGDSVRSGSIFQFVSAMLVLSIVLIILHRNRRGFASLFFGSVFLGAIAYIAILIALYQVVFDKSEAVALASFERYLGSYYLAWCAFLLIALCASLAQLRVWFGKFVVVVVCVSVIISLPTVAIRELQNVTNTHYYNWSTIDQVEALARVVKKYIHPGEKVFFVHQNSVGYENFAFYYSMYPNKTQWWCWSLGEPYGLDDLYTCNGKTLNDFLIDYTYLAINHADDRFWKDHGHLFDDNAIGSDSGVFKVDKVDGVVNHLTKVE